MEHVGLAFARKIYLAEKVAKYAFLDCNTPEVKDAAKALIIAQAKEVSARKDLIAAKTELAVWSNTKKLLEETVKSAKARGNAAAAAAKNLYREKLRHISVYNGAEKAKVATSAEWMAYVAIEKKVNYDDDAWKEGALAVENKGSERWPIPTEAVAAFAFSRAARLMMGCGRFHSEKDLWEHWKDIQPSKLREISDNVEKHKKIVSIAEENLVFAAADLSSRREKEEQIFETMLKIIIDGDKYFWCEETDSLWTVHEDDTLGQWVGYFQPENTESPIRFTEGPEEE